MPSATEADGAPEMIATTCTLPTTSAHLQDVIAADSEVAVTGSIADGCWLAAPAQAISDHCCEAPVVREVAVADADAAAGDSARNVADSVQQADDLQALLARLQDRSEEESAEVQARLLALAQAAPAAPGGCAARSRALKSGLVSRRGGGSGGKRGGSGGKRSGSSNASRGGSGGHGNWVPTANAVANGRGGRPPQPSAAQAAAAAAAGSCESPSSPQLLRGGALLPPASEWRPTDLTDGADDLELIGSEVRVAGLDVGQDVDCDADDDWTPAATVASAAALADPVSPLRPAALRRRSSCSGNSGSSVASGRRSETHEIRPVSPPRRWTPQGLVGGGVDDTTTRSNERAGAGAGSWPMYSDNDIFSNEELQQPQLQYPGPDFCAAETVRRVLQNRPSSGAKFRLRLPSQAQQCSTMVMRRSSSRSASSRRGGAAARLLQSWGSAGGDRQGGGSGKRWAGVAPPGVQLYGRVHFWKERNKQRYEATRKEMEEEALQGCTFKPAINPTLQRAHSAAKSAPATPLTCRSGAGSRPATPKSPARPKTPGTAAAAAAALDFRAFTAQQQALEAVQERSQMAADGSGIATLSMQATGAGSACAADCVEAGDAETALGAGATGAAPSADADDAQAAPAAPAAKVYRRLYNAAMTSQRRKEAFVRAAAAEEAAALKAATPRALPLPSKLYEAQTPRPQSAGGRQKEAFVGDAACTFRPKTNLQLRPRSRPLTTTKAQLLPLASPLDLRHAASAPSPGGTAAGGDSPKLRRPTTPAAAAAADAGHVTSSGTDGGTLPIVLAEGEADIASAHEAAAAALARLAYVEARHALAGRAPQNLPAGVNGHLDWDEFLRRQTRFLQAKDEHSEAARQEEIPAGRPELCPTSRKLLQHIRTRSSQVGPAARPHAADRDLLIPTGREEETFSPKIGKDAHRRAARSAKQMSAGDALRHELHLEHARHEAALRQLQELTLHPVINRNYAGVRPAISLKQPGPYLAEVAATKSRWAEEHYQRQLQAKEAEMVECTFRPQTKKLPVYIGRMAASYQAKKAVRGGRSRTQSQDWM